MQLRRGEVRALEADADASAGWRVYEYRVHAGWIEADEDKDWRSYRPLAEPMLFASFARLASHGRPSEESVLAWTRRYGLLWQEPEPLRVRLEDFRDAAVEARGALDLLEAVRARDLSAIRPRLELRDNPGPDGVVEVLIDGKLQGAFRSPGWRNKRHDAPVLTFVVRALEATVSGNLSRLQRRFTTASADFEHPGPLGAWRPRLEDHCPDLFTALWYQFARIMEERRPVRRCSQCGEPFLPLRSTKKTCSAACRKARSRTLAQAPVHQ